MPITFALHPTPPYRLDLTAWALKRRSDYAVDQWDAATETYRRVFAIDSRAVEASVVQEGDADAPRLDVTLASASDAPVTDAQVAAARAGLARLLGVHTDLAGFHRRVAEDPALGPLALRLRGLKPPRYLTLFETLTNAITCQQITLVAGLRILNRLTEACGLPFDRPDGDGRAYAFPRAEDVAARMTADRLLTLGYSRQKARAVMELAALAAPAEDDALDEDVLRSLSDEEAAARLRRLHGVGRWTAEYALLRGLGRLNVFPGDDVGVRKHVERWLGYAEKLDYAGVQAALARWQGYGGLVYLHLLVASLADAGLVAA